MTKEDEFISPTEAGAPFEPIIGTWRGSLTRLKSGDPIRDRSEEEIICVIRESRVPEGKAMAFIFAVDDEHLASAETLNVTRDDVGNGWIAKEVLLAPGHWRLALEQGRLVGSYVDNQSGTRLKQFEARRMVVW